MATNKTATARVSSIAPRNTSVPPVSPISGTIVQQFLKFDHRGKVDMKATLAYFGDCVEMTLKAQEDIKPTILHELGEYGKLGENNLVAYALHSLHMVNTEENASKIRSAIQDLERDGTIVYQTGESGARRGRNVGWTLSQLGTQNAE